MTEQEMQTLLESMDQTKSEGKVKYLEFHMDFEVVAVEITMSLN